MVSFQSTRGFSFVDSLVALCLVGLFLSASIDSIGVLRSLQQQRIQHHQLQLIKQNLSHSVIALSVRELLENVQTIELHSEQCQKQDCSNGCQTEDAIVRWQLMTSCYVNSRNTVSGRWHWQRGDVISILNIAVFLDSQCLYEKQCSSSTLPLKLGNQQWI